MSTKILIMMTMLIAGLMVGCTQIQSSYEPGNGRMVVGITDAAADMGDVSEVQVTVSQVQAHNAQKGWITLSSEARTYDLLKLKAQGSTELLADVQLPEGDYQQIRLQISKVVVVDSNGAHDAKMPSGELRIMTDISVRENTTSSATFDFIADESLHMTGNGQYILAPVIFVETRDRAEVDVGFDRRVTVRGGNVKTSSKVGMDVDGNVGVGKKIDSGLNLEIGGNGRPKIVQSNSDTDNPGIIETPIIPITGEKEYTCSLEISPATITAGSSTDISISVYTPDRVEFEYNCGNDVRGITTGGLSKLTRLCQFNDVGVVNVWVKADGKICAQKTLIVKPRETLSQVAKTCSIDSASVKRDLSSYYYEAKVNFAGFSAQDEIVWTCDYTVATQKLGDGGLFVDSRSKVISCDYDDRPVKESITVSVGNMNCGTISTR